MAYWVPVIVRVLLKLETPVILEETVNVRMAGTDCPGVSIVDC